MKRVVEDISKNMSVDNIVLCDTIEEISMNRVDGIINTTSVGLKKEDESIVSPYDIYSDMFVYDLIYNPGETKLLKYAKENGARVSNGLGMLYYQAILSLEHWAEVRLGEKIKNIVRKKLEEQLIKRNF